MSYSWEAGKLPRSRDAQTCTQLASLPTALQEPFMVPTNWLAQLTVTKLEIMAQAYLKTAENPKHTLEPLLQLIQEVIKVCNSS